MNSNKLNFPFSLTPVAALVAGLTLALPGQAQQSDVTGSSLTLEEVVVSARKITESLQDVPSAVSAVKNSSHVAADTNGPSLRGICPRIGFPRG